jgi:hypothetical protein
MSAQWARARASRASVFANGPVARAKSRAWRGCTTTTGRPAVATAAVAMRSRPPAAANTIRMGWSVCSRSPSVTMPPVSCGTVQRSPEGRTAISHWAFATSIPTQQGTSTIGTPVGPPLPRRALRHQTTVWACGAPDVTPHAPLRSAWTKAQSVCHVQALSDGESPTSPNKDTRLFPVACRPLLGAGVGRDPRLDTCRAHLRLGVRFWPARLASRLPAHLAPSRNPACSITP